MTAKIGIKQADELVAAARSAGLTVEVEIARRAGHHYEAADYTAPDSLSVRVRIEAPGTSHVISARWSKRLIKGGRGTLIAARETTSHSSTDLKPAGLSTALRRLVTASRNAGRAAEVKAKPRTLRRDQNTNGYVTSDGRYEVTPVYGPSIRGGDVTRPTEWCLKDRKGEYEPRYRPFLSDIRDILKERP
ncbi:hypothetical protein [Streptomyces roseochromogenus]|uniref:Uncharacterized protein n=1 Tax=Streptomyces roseochromogenus subsp. oscitans DS 12.976 TaxID=1352936 RepID=V6JFW7_STRRC|nr:hypothetical protein [Streptomyces roseochromogenus]EST18066.1 hypothetical protein M878_45725 [Streptomyces roseochromogenus subsp. oscitans DS 12.976]